MTNDPRYHHIDGVKDVTMTNPKMERVAPLSDMEVDALVSLARLHEVPDAKIDEFKRLSQTAQRSERFTELHREISALPVPMGQFHY